MGEESRESESGEPVSAEARRLPWPFPLLVRRSSGYHMSYVFFGHVVFYNVQIEKSN